MWALEYSACLALFGVPGHGHLGGDDAVFKELILKLMSFWIVARMVRNIELNEHSLSISCLIL